MAAHFTPKYLFVFVACLLCVFSVLNVNGFVLHGSSSEEDSSDSLSSSEESKGRPGRPGRPGKPGKTDRPGRPKDDWRDKWDKNKDKDKKFKCPESYGAFSDVTDCNAYYVCRAGKSTRKTCNRKHHFDMFRKTCMPAWIAVCDDGKGAKTTTTKKGGEGTTPSDKDSFTCPSFSGSYPHPDDCSKYYECIFFKPSIKSCPEGKLFDGVKKACKPEREVHCGSRWRPATPQPSSTPTRPSPSPRHTHSPRPSPSPRHTSPRPSPSPRHTSPRPSPSPRHTHSPRPSPSPRHTSPRPSPSPRHTHSPRPSPSPRHTSPRSSPSPGHTHSPRPTPTSELRSSPDFSRQTSTPELRTSPDFSRPTPEVSTSPEPPVTTLEPTTTSMPTPEPTITTIPPKPTGPPETNCDDDDLDCIIKETGEIPDWFECPVAVGSYRHPSSNKLFIFCLNWKPKVKKCGQDLIYSEEMRTCVKPAQ